jgi:acetoin utilization deacetylase AcuC-like enzyme
MRVIGFPWSAQLVERSRRSVGATIAAARAAVADGVGVNLAGGTHHAFADRGEGFCLFNDVGVAARVLQRERIVDRVLVIDCDVHQGNGTAAIFARDTSVTTFSIHGKRNYPLRKARSDLDVALDDNTGDDEYLRALADALEQVLPLAEAELAFYLAGADPYRDDRFGRLAMTKQGLRRRDQLVLSRCRQWGMPVAIAMAGGYAPQLDDIVDIHAATVDVARAVLRA